MTKQDAPHPPAASVHHRATQRTENRLPKRRTVLASPAGLAGTGAAAGSYVVLIEPRELAIGAAAHRL